nr:hypothetical protein Iba_chr15aCG13210 [Ipomoea batatas]
MSGVSFLQQPLMLQMQLVLESLHGFPVYDLNETLGIGGECGRLDGDDGICRWDEVGWDDEERDGAGGCVGGSCDVAAALLASLASFLVFRVQPRFMVDKSSSDRGVMLIMSGVSFLQQPLMLQMQLVLESLHGFPVYDLNETLGAVGKDDDSARVGSLADGATDSEKIESSEIGLEGNVVD